MSEYRGLSDRIETASLYFQGGVRRWVVVFALISIILIIPIYYLGRSSSQLFFYLPFNTYGFEKKDLVDSKVIQINDFRLDRTQFVPLVNNETVLYTTVNNRSNSTIGYWPLVYRVQVLDKDGAILSDNIQSDYLLPGEIKYIVATSSDDLGATLNISTEPGTQSKIFNPATDNLAQRVNVEVRNPLVSEIEGSDDISLSAIIKNNDFVLLRRLDLLYIIRDDRDRVVGIGKFSLDNIEPYEERDFRLNYPKPRFRRPTRLDIRANVNYLDPNSVVLR